MDDDIAHTLIQEIRDQNELIRQQNEYLEYIADSLEDRVMQEGLLGGFELYTDENGRRRQA